MVQEAGVLVSKAVVVLLPDMGGQHIVERGDLLPPGELVADLKPLGMLGEHGVHDADKGLIGVEEAVAAGEQIALQHALAHMLREHGVHDAAVLVEVIVRVPDFTVPDAVRRLENGVEAVGVILIGGEGAEVALFLVELENVADKFSELGHILGLDSAGGGDIHRVVTKVRHFQIAQQQAPVCVRIGAHAAPALGRQLTQLLDGRTVCVEQLLGFIASEPVFQQADMLLGVGRDRHLMGAPVALDLCTVHKCRGSPALWGAQYDHWPAGALAVPVLAGGFLILQDLLHTFVQRIGHQAVHLHGVASLNKVRLPAAADEEALQLLMGDAGKHGGVCDLVAV